MKKRVTSKVVIPEFIDVSQHVDAESEKFLDISTKISDRIFHLIHKLGWNQKELAEKMGKSEPEISKLLGGYHNYTLRMLAKMETVLGESVIFVPHEEERKTDNYRVETEGKEEWRFELKNAHIESLEKTWDTDPVPQIAKVVAFKGDDSATEGAKYYLPAS